MDFKENKIKFEFFDENIKVNETSTILDIGFGTGAFCYRLYHLFGVTDLYGVEKEKEEEVGKYIGNVQTKEWDKSKGYRYGISNNYQLYQQFLEYELISNNEITFKNPIIEKEVTFNEIFNKLKNDIVFDAKRFKNCQFDLIIVSDILHYKNDTGCNGLDCIDEYLKLLKPNGYLYISILLEKDGKDRNFITQEEVTSKIQQLNLKFIEEKIYSEKNINFRPDNFDEYEKCISKILLFIEKK